tara:strand:+ start:3380 stop:3727 length:348 start_codon:yes stop_codon:yes gene_type:complete
MKWPPVKAWTKSEIQNQYRYFVAINYGGEGDNRWVNLVSVLNGEVRMRVSWKQINNKSDWNAGWIYLEGKVNSKNLVIREKNIALIQSAKSVCLHPSKDSGLCIPSKTDSPRAWF